MAPHSRERVLVTGATSGIGLALAERLSPEAELLIAGRRPEEEARGLIPSGTTYVQADQLRPLEAADRIAGALAKLGWDRLDRAFLNAGTGAAIDPLLEDTSTIRRTLDVNLLATIAIAHALHPALAAARGRLILVGSIAHRGAPGFASYAASKAGLDGFARALAEEWRGRIGVRAIHPGPVATDMHRKAGHDPGALARFFLSPASAAELIDLGSRRRRARFNAGHGALVLHRLGLWR